MLRAEELLGDGEKSWDESSLKTVQNGTKINQKAFEDLGKPQGEIPADAGKTKYLLFYIFILLVLLKNICLKFVIESKPYRVPSFSLIIC